MKGTKHNVRWDIIQVKNDLLLQFSNFFAVSDNKYIGISKNAEILETNFQPLPHFCVPDRFRCVKLPEERLRKFLRAVVLQEMNHRLWQNVAQDAILNNVRTFSLNGK